MTKKKIPKPKPKKRRLDFDDDEFNWAVGQPNDEASKESGNK